MFELNNITLLLKNINESYLKFNINQYILNKINEFDY